MKKKIIAMLLAMSVVVGTTACASTDSKKDETASTDTLDSSASTEASTDVATEAAQPAVTELNGSQVVIVEGQDWGPAVTKTVIKLDNSVSASTISSDLFSVTETKESFNWAALMEGSTEDPTEHITTDTELQVVAAYTSDENGNQTEDSNYITLEFGYDPNTGNPFCYDIFIGNNTICSPYELTITLKDGSVITTSDGSEISDFNVSSEIDFDSALYPQLENVDISGSFTGSEGHTFAYASYEPESDGSKHPLVIWLHGAGEGGNDPRLNTLGNEVTSLFSDEFQEIMGGAYVLAPQCPTFWMQYDEEGNWSDNQGVDSIYLSDLKELIDNYVAEHGDVDINRIIIGGCSNGGYMTMDMIFNYPDYFAAAYPICEAYMDAGITKEQLEAIKDLPIWFIYAENDTTVDPSTFEVPTIERLRSLGADVHTSVFADVHDTSGNYIGEDGSAYQFMGHWSWIYFFNNQCEEDGVNLWQWLAQQSK